MYNEDTEIIFPSRVIPNLTNLRGPEWDQLVKSVNLAKESAVEHLAFVLLMVKLGGCTSCNTDSFRAMRGCTQCAKLTIKRYRGDDTGLLEEYQEACRQIKEYQVSNSTRN